MLNSAADDRSFPSIAILVAGSGRDKQAAYSERLQSTTTPCQGFVHGREQEERVIEREMIKKEGRLVVDAGERSRKRERKEREAED